VNVGTDGLSDDLADLWPLVSGPEDYAVEARWWHDALRNKAGLDRHEIRELAVGGGNNLSHLTDGFQATSVDVSPGMLAHSKRLNPRVEHHLGDMH
jgi:SAM-dependent methyltransferase